MPETEFRPQLIELLNERMPSAHDPAGHAVRRMRRAASQTPNHVLFLVDDALFVRPFRLEVAAQALDSNADALGFSLRLGRNTSNCYVLGRAQALPEFEPIGWRSAQIPLAGG